jgi:hypothetical protein
MKMKSLLLTIAATIGLTAGTMAQNVPNYLPTNGLVGWWPFNGNATDESGNGNNGTVNGATLTTDRFGNFNKAYSFNGIDNHITISNIATSLITDSYSVSFWLLTTDTSIQYDGHEVISDRDISSFDFKFRLNYGIQQPPFLQNTYLQTCSNSNNTCFSINTSLPDFSIWENYFMTYNGNSNTFKAYKNGILLDSIANVDFSAGNRQINIGRSVNPDNINGNAYYNGLVDDIGIWNRALTQQEITELHNGDICYQTITVTDTLLINMGIISYSPVIYSNTIKIFPNPTNDHITIDYGNFASLNGYQLKIINSLSQNVFQTNITQQSDYLNLTTWGGNGLYFVQIIDQQGNIIDIRKIVLQ